MKRKTFQKRLMAFGIQRNEASELSRKIKAAYPRMKESDAIGACATAYIMAPAKARLEICCGYYFGVKDGLKKQGLKETKENAFLSAFSAANNLLYYAAMNRAECELFYGDDQEEIVADPKKYPDLMMCVKVGDVLGARWKRISGLVEEPC